MKFLTILTFVLLAALVSSEIYFQDNFETLDGWVVSEVVENQGKIDLSAGEFFLDAEANKGLQLTQDAKFYAVSKKFDEFSNKGKDLVIQYRIKHEQKIDCGGGYIKLIPAGFDETQFNGDTDYNIMFGPDICGSTKKIHVIFNYKGDNHLITQTITPETDVFSHVYTLVVKADNTYEVLVDNQLKKSGSLEEHFDMLPPKHIKDPEQSKPADWVDEKKIADPEDTKPEGYDDIPATIADPEATKPEDWDDDLDGDWEAPTIPNPEYQGPWTPRLIENPDYIGEWVHPEIDNPEYYYDENLYAYDSFGGVGIEVWQVKSGSIFDNILITDDTETASAAADELVKITAAEKEAKKEADEAAAAAEEAAKAAAAAEESEADEAEQDKVDL
eukprot:TRINITY_DN10548_c0_g1_i1.p1 TRINITY_DN10548_c0_g1~~TRINITY_DN10548_c0_g1_i1.p1  ORF type:complete len:388 (-),score=153.96 TRINITY_DN10548_c0_g1_i1:34-1197(-)